MDSSLVEKDLRKTITQKGYPAWAAEWAHAISPKYAFFCANNIPKTFLRRVTGQSGGLTPEQQQMVNEFIADSPLDERLSHVIRNLFQNEEKPQLAKKPNDLTVEEGEQLIRELNYMKDWWRNPAVQGIVPQNYAWADAKALAHAWHEEMAKKAEEQEQGELALDDGQEIVVKFDDESYWLDLATDFCRDEGNAMGHCGSASIGTLFSLRDKLGRPKITADIDVDNKVAGQIFGKGNTTPKQEYHRKILQLLGTLKIERIKTENHGQRSFAFSDLQQEDIEWFEETFGYSIAGGASQEQIDAARKVIEGETALKHSYLNFNDDGGEGYIDVSQSVYWTLSDMFDFSPDFDYAQARSIDESSVTDHMGGDHVDSGWEIHGGDVIFRADSRLGYFNTSEDTGSIEGSGRSFDDIVSWAEECVDDTKYGDEKLGGEGFVGLVGALIDAGYILDGPLNKLFDEELEAEMVIDRNGSAVKVNLSLGEFELDSKQVGKGVAARLQNKLNKVDPLLALLRKPKSKVAYEQPELDFGEALIEELLGEASTQGRFVYLVKEISTPDRSRGYGDTKYVLSVTATIELSSGDEEGIDAAVFYTENPEEARACVTAVLGFGDRNLQRAYGLAVSKSNKLRSQESVSLFLGIMAPTDKQH